LQYLEGSIRDERIRQRCLVHQAQAPEHTLHYSELQWDFPSDYTRVALGETSPQEPVTIFADSFDTQRDAEFFGKTLPQSISEFLTRCKLVCQLEEYVAPGDERWLDWPPPQDLDPELIMDKARPFELTHPRDHRQLLLNVDPRVHGVFVCRAKDQDGEYYIVSNVPSTVFNRSTTYEWGYDGAGPSDLALNILNYFMPPGSDGAEPQQMPECYWSRNQRSSASETAVKLAGKFKEEFIRNLPAWGGVIAASRIKAWLLRQAAEQS
jgi:hypothetical protein